MLWLKQHTLAENFQQLYTADGVSLLGASAWQAQGVRVILIYTLLLGFGMVLCRCEWDGLWRPAALWLTLAFGLFLTILLGPHSLDGAFYLTDRLIIVLWIAVLLAATDQPPLGRTQLRLVITSVVAATSFTVFAANSLIRPVAETIAASIALRNPAIADREGMLFAPSQKAADASADLAFWPYAWAGAHYFRINEAFLYNGSWLEHEFFPLGTSRRTPLGSVVVDVGSPMALLLDMRKDQDLRRIAAADADFAMLYDPAQGTDLLQPLIRTSAFTAQGWFCLPMVAPWRTQCYVGTKRSDSQERAHLR